MRLVVPTLDYLDGFVRALARGWSPDNLRPEAAAELLEDIAADASAFVRRQEDPNAEGGPVQLPDGSFVPRLPGIVRWMWEDDFVGSIGLRWPRDLGALPPYCLGHIGYAVVPWARRNGFATTALRLMLDEARAVGLEQVELTTDPDNFASIRVIEKNGGRLVERFNKGPQYGNDAALRFTIGLTTPATATPPAESATD